MNPLVWCGLLLLSTATCYCRMLQVNLPLTTDSSDYQTYSHKANENGVDNIRKLILDVPKDLSRRRNSKMGVSLLCLSKQFYHFCKDSRRQTMNDYDESEVLSKETPSLQVGYNPYQSEKYNTYSPKRIIKKSNRHKNFYFQGMHRNTRPVSQKPDSSFQNMLNSWAKANHC